MDLLKTENLFKLKNLDLILIIYLIKVFASHLKNLRLYPVHGITPDSWSEKLKTNVIYEKFNMFIYGFYPREKRWRVNIIFVFFFAYNLYYKYLRKSFNENPINRIIIFMLIGIISYILADGGMGLEEVETHQWGGLLLHIILVISTIIFSVPLIYLLIIGKQSSIVTMKLFSKFFIYLFTNTPLIIFLFFGSMTLNYLFKKNTNLEAVPRAMIMYVLYFSCKIANKMDTSSIITIFNNLLYKQRNIFLSGLVVYIIGLFNIVAFVNTVASDPNWLGSEETLYYLAIILIMIVNKLLIY
jgi:general L-amino acid transport system permease protein